MKIEIILSDKDEEEVAYVPAVERSAAQARDLLISEIRGEFERAKGYGIVDTNSIVGRQIIYMKLACQRFVDKYKDFRII